MSSILSRYIEAPTANKRSSQHQKLRHATNIQNPRESAPERAASQIQNFRHATKPRFRLAVRIRRGQKEIMPTMKGTSQCSGMQQRVLFQAGLQNVGDVRKVSTI
ncbi:hypothetical protein BPOR_0136g00110 [Botrytis porri]|uniref:Uncharacterized protein n=1 Tax=Botrytis porri TaxID=87229 RepID=A0A4Z1KWI7_9HELO|nr:hypothetical protein BPOR_0136g00110 [Botrytis porri]